MHFNDAKSFPIFFLLFKHKNCLGHKEASAPLLTFPNNAMYHHRETILSN